MKKILSLILCVLMLCILTVPVSAAEDTEFVITADKREARQGEKVTFTITLENSAELTSFGFLMDYDADVFTLVDAECLVEGATIASWNGMGFSAAFLSETAYSGIVGTITLQVKKGAADGSSEVSLGRTSVKNGLTDIAYTTGRAAVSVDIEVETTPMFRLYNPNSGEHFYTGSEEERDGLTDAGWNYEGVAWNAPVVGTPVYRVYNPNSGDHHYTMSESESDLLVSLGWQYEGVAWNTASPENIPQYRLWNPNADLGSHHYTSSEEERDSLIAAGWIFEGIGWYGMLK